MFKENRFVFQEKEPGAKPKQGLNRLEGAQVAVASRRELNARSGEVGEATNAENLEGIKNTIDGKTETKLYEYGFAINKEGITPLMVGKIIPFDEKTKEVSGFVDNRGRVNVIMTNKDGSVDTLLISKDSCSYNGTEIKFGDKTLAQVKEMMRESFRELTEQYNTFPDSQLPELMRHYTEQLFYSLDGNDRAEAMLQSVVCRFQNLLMTRVKSLDDAKLVQKELDRLKMVLEMSSSERNPGSDLKQRGREEVALQWTNKIKMYAKSFMPAYEKTRAEELGDLVLEPELQDLMKVYGDKGWVNRNRDGDLGLGPDVIRVPVSNRSPDPKFVYENSPYTYRPNGGTFRCVNYPDAYPKMNLEEFKKFIEKEHK